MFQTLVAADGCIIMRVGRKVPEFRLQCVEAHPPRCYWLDGSSFRGRWLMLLFYPRDFSFVCPTELVAFSARLPDFQELNCQILAISVDDVATHRRWLATGPEDGGVGGLRFPLGADPDGEVARAFHVWNDEQQLAERALLLIDPEGMLQYEVIHSQNVGRNVDEVLRVMAALRTGGLCPASWTRADGTIDVQQSLRPGRVLGSYRIERLLGRGTFGTVFAATDLRLQRIVALKILHASLEESRPALLQEARAAAVIHHPNVCTIFAVDEHDGLPVVAMHYVDGPSLSELIAEGIDRERFVTLGRQIAAGLAAAHQQHIVHGDIKPANILISRDETAYLVDFGFAIARQPALAEHSTRRVSLAGVSAALTSRSGIDTPERLDETAALAAAGGSITGTPAYLSPEQAAGQTPEAASDIFSLGLVFAEMLTGRRVLQETSLMRLLRALQTEHLALRIATEDVAPHAELLADMLSPDPAHRPAAIDVVRRLNA